MYHPDRRFSVVPVEEEEELAQKLIERTWPGCMGFSHGGYLFLNDSATPADTQEYAVFGNRPDETGKYTQVDGLTVGWMGRAEALQRIQRITRGEFGALLGAEHFLKVENPGEHGSCRECE